MAGYATGGYTSKMDLAVGEDTNQDATKEMSKIRASERGSPSVLHAPSTEEQAEGAWFPTDVPFTS